MRASAHELNAQQIEFHVSQPLLLECMPAGRGWMSWTCLQLESTEDLLCFARPQYIYIKDFTTGQKIKLKGTRKSYNAVRSKLLKKKK